MAITKIMHMKQAKSGYMAKHLANGLKYIMDPDKTEDGRYISGNNCFPENALEQMLETKRHFGKLDKRQGYHFIISFEEEEITEDTAFELVGEFVKEYLGKDYEAVYAIHNDTDHIHGHIIFNSVRCTDGYKYDYPKGEWEHRIQPLVNDLCKKYGLSILDLEEVKEKKSAGRKEKQQSRVRKRKIPLGIKGSNGTLTVQSKTQRLMKSFWRICVVWDMSCPARNILPSGKQVPKECGVWICWAKNIRKKCSAIGLNIVLVQFRRRIRIRKN